VVFAGKSAFVESFKVTQPVGWSELVTVFTGVGVTDNFVGVCAAIGVDLKVDFAVGTGEFVGIGTIIAGAPGDSVAGG